MSIAGMVSTGDQEPRTKSKAGRVTPLRIGFWGTRSIFSTQVLAALVKDTPITQVAVPADKTAATAVTLVYPPPTTLQSDELLLVNNYVRPEPIQLAWQHQVQTAQVHRLHTPAVAQWLATLALDVVCVACFPWRIPTSLLALPTYGFLNLHPSLLPAHRGPAPLFWQLRAGLRTIGVTAHWMDPDFDTGPLAAQRPLVLPDGVSAAEIDRRCAAVGASLLRMVLQQLAQGVVPRQHQLHAGSHQSWPTAAAFRLDCQWSAQHAYNFMRGTADWQQPYPLAVAGEELWLRTALRYEADQTLPQPLIRHGVEAAIQFHQGVLYALCW